MEKYEILEHKADLKIRAFGKSKEELFLNAMLAMMEGIRPEIKIPEEKINRGVEINSFDLPALLVDFLSEILYQSQVNREIYNDIKFIKFIDIEIDAVVKGIKVKRFENDIKAVTYHGLDVSQRQNGIWEAIVLFDI